MRSPFALPLLALLALLAAGARSQSGAQPAPAPAARLQELLRELRATDPAAWAAQVQALEQQAKACEAEAAKLRAEASTLQQRAERAIADANAKRAERDKLLELQKLVGTLPTPPSPPAPAAPPAKAPDAPPPTKAAAPATKTGEPKAAAPAASTKPRAGEPKADAADARDVVAWPQVATIFSATCTGCHEPGEQKGGLDLTTFRGAVTGGGSGQSIVPGEPDQSRLYRMIAQEERPFMPRNADPLSKEQLATVRTWIEQGAAETVDAARSFVVERAKKTKDSAAAAAPKANAASADASLAVATPSEVPKLPLQIPSRPGPIASLVRSPAAPLLALPGAQQVLLLGVDGSLQAVLPCATKQLGPLAFAEDGSALLAAGGEAGRRGIGTVYDVRTGAVLASCGDERDVPLAAALHRGSGLLALGGAGKHARVHRLGDGGLVMAGKHADFVLALAFAPDGKWLAAADRAGNVVVWETGTGRAFQNLAGHAGAVHAVAFDATGKNLLTAGADGTLRLWDVAAGKERWRQTAHPNQQALACAFGPGDLIASCGSDGVIATFTTAGRPGVKSAGVGEWLYAVAFGQGANDVFAGDWRGRLHRFDVAKKTLTSTVPLAAAP